MVKVAVIMFAGILAGYLLRDKQTIISLNAKLTLWVIYLLLFFLGLAIGHNQYIVQQLSSLGWMAFIITLAAVGGSLLTSWLLWRFVFSRKEPQT